MNNLLNKLIKNKQQEIAEKKKKRDFLGVVIHPKVEDISIIAEIKLASPSEGRLGDKNQIEKRAIMYEKSFADAISVVVDKKYFAGELEFIRLIKNVVSLPILAKDFIIDPYQIYEMKTYGADAILIIAKISKVNQLVKLVKLSKELNIEPVVEVQTEQELENALNTDTKIIAVNARDLDTFKIDIGMACRLLQRIPQKYVTLGFSGILGRSEVEKYKKAGAKGVLVGTSLMKAGNIKEYLTSLRAT